MATQLDTFSTAGTFTYTIPAWASKIDIIALGGGGGGSGGNSAFNNGKAGAAGSYNAGLTLTRGLDFPLSKTTFPVTVGAAGAGGVGNVGAADLESALNTEYGATGPGAAGSGTGSVALSWTHTPNDYDNYVVVSLAASVTGGSYTTHTRTVTYGGTAMTSLGAVNANNSTGGWVESFGIAVTPLAGPKTVLVGVGKVAAVYSSVKANSVSYGNVNTATVSAVTGSGSDTSAAFTSTSYTASGAVVCSVLGLSSTVSGTVSGMTHRSLNNTAPSLLILETNLAYSYYPVATFAATTQYAAIAVTLQSRVSGGGGAGNSITWVSPSSNGRGGSPGNKTFNGQTYVGGTGSLNTDLGATPATATAPGAGGGGSGGFLLGPTSNGGNGSAGKVWVYAYGTLASGDAATTATATSGGSLSRATKVDAATTATATFSASGIRNAPVAASGVTATATTTAGLTRTTPVTAALTGVAAPAAETIRTVIADANLAATAKVSDPWQLQGFQGLFFWYDRNGLPYTPGTVSAGYGVAAATVATAASTASSLKATNVQASITATATFSASETRGVLVAASITALATPDASGGRGQFIGASLSATGATGTPQPLYNAGAFSSLFVNSLFSASGLRTLIGQAALTSTAAAVANLTEFGIATASITATAARTGNLVSNQLIASAATGTAITAGDLLKTQKLDATGVTATGATSGALSYGASAAANLLSTALFSSSIVKIRLLSGSLTVTATAAAEMSENTVAQAAFTATATPAAALTKTRNAQAATIVTAILDAEAAAKKGMQAALTVVAYRDGMIDEPREIVYVQADDRNAAVETVDRKVYIQDYDRYAEVPSYSDRTVMVDTTEISQAISRDALDGFRGLFFWFVELPMIRSSSRSYPIGDDYRSVSVDAEDRDALVPATRPESLLK